MTTDMIPAEILNAFYRDGITSQTLIMGGEINTTFLIVDKYSKKTVLQRLSHIYDTSSAEDYKVVSTHLKSLAWEMAAVIEATNGAAYVLDNSGRLWRAFSYIESIPGSSLEGDTNANIALGGILGRLHHSLALLDYQPKSPGHSHEVARTANHLSEIMLTIKEPVLRKLAKKFLAIYEELSIDETPIQLLHGDPRIGNVLFRDGRPFTFIDWDGMIVANPLVNVGDMLQSIVSELKPENRASFSIELLFPVIEAYYREAGLRSNKQIFQRSALAAGQLIAVNLGMRHLIDSVEDSYFTPPNQVESRYAFNIRRASEQWKVYGSLKAY